MIMDLLGIDKSLSLVHLWKCVRSRTCNGKFQKCVNLILANVACKPVCKPLLINISIRCVWFFVIGLLLSSNSLEEGLLSSAK